MPDEGIGCGFTEAVRGVLSHHMVIKGGKIANYHPYPPTPWNANPRDSLRHARARTRTRCMNTPIFEENDLEHFKGIDIMRAVRSFDPCLPCGVHMYLGKGKVLKKLHSPTQVADDTAEPADQPIRSEPGGIDMPRAEPSGSRRPDRGAARRAAARRRSACRSAIAEELLRSVTELYGGGLERAWSSSSERARPALLERARRRRAGRQPARRARPAPRRRRDAGRARARVGAAVPRRARRRRRAARHRRRCRRGAPPAARSCDGCPSSARHAADGGREGDRRGRAGDRDHRRRAAGDRGATTRRCSVT